jgi:hypothetical protein
MPPSACVMRFGKDSRNESESESESESENESVSVRVRGIENGEDD